MNNNIRRKSGAIWISGKIRGGWKRADEVVPIHLKYPLEKIYNFIEVGSSSSNWRLALAQAEPGSQHQGWVPLGELGALGVMGRLGTLGALGGSAIRLFLRHTSPGSQHHEGSFVLGFSPATGSASASATRLTLWHGWPGLLQKASTLAMAAVNIKY